MKRNNLCKKFNMKEYFTLDKINPHCVYAISMGIYIEAHCYNRNRYWCNTSLEIQKKLKNTGRTIEVFRCLFMIIKLLSNVMKIIHTSHTIVVYQTPL